MKKSSHSGTKYARKRLDSGIARRISVTSESPSTRSGQTLHAKACEHPLESKQVYSGLPPLLESVFPKSVGPTGLTAPSVLSPAPVPTGWFDKKEELKLPDKHLGSFARSLLGTRIYRISLGTNLAIAANSSGFVNSIIAVNSVAMTGEFASFANIFDEYFVVSMKASYMPVSRYNYPLTGVTATSVSSLPLQTVCLQHDSPAYTTTSAMANHASCKMRSTGDPFVTKWINTESYRIPTVVNPSTTLVATQSWCETGSVAAPGYTGAIQYLTDQATPPLQIGARIGSFLVQYDVLFRARA
jgi:hypothetical protein